MLLAVVPLATMATFEAIAPVAVSYEHVIGAALARRLFDLADRHRRCASPSDPCGRGRPRGRIENLCTAGEVEFDHVTLRYQPDRPDVLRDTTFTVPPGAEAAVVGPSGAGKSTIAALGLRGSGVPVPATNRIDGRDLWDIGSVAARPMPPWSPRMDTIFEMTREQPPAG